MKSKEELFDYNTDAQKSDINLEGANVSGDLGFDGYVLKELYSDFIFAEYIDMSKGFQTAKSGLVTVDTKTKSWRKAIVRMVGSAVAKYGITKVGDVILFPNDKGLPTGRVSYLNADGEVKMATDGIFLNENRIFAKVENKS